MSNLHREEVWCEERITEMEIMVMMKLGKCPEDWVTEVKSTTHHRRVRSIYPKPRGQSNKIILITNDQNVGLEGVHIENIKNHCRCNIED